MVELHFTLMIISFICTIAVATIGKAWLTLFCLTGVVMNLLAALSYEGVI